MDSPSAGTDSAGGSAEPNWAFVNAGIALVLLTVGPGAPASLLTASGASQAALTGSFSMYMLGTALALLFLSRLSDVIGRAAGAASAVLAAIVGNAVVAWSTGHTELLVIGRLAQGVATGVGLPVLTIYLIELRVPRPDMWPALISSVGAPLGIAIGAFAAGVLTETLGFSGYWIYVVVNLSLACCLRGLLRSPSTTSRRVGGLDAFRPALSAPKGLRLLCAATGAAMVSAWSIGSLYQSLGAPMAVEYLGHQGPLFAGVVVGLVIGLTTVGGPLLARASHFNAAFCSLLMIVVGMMMMVRGLHLRSDVVFLAFSALSGISFGGATTAILRIVVAEVPTEEMSRFLTTLYLAGFIGSGLPSAVAAVAEPYVGVRAAVVGYAAFIAVFAVLAGALLTRVRHTRRDIPAPAVE